MRFLSISLMIIISAPFRESRPRPLRLVEIDGLKGASVV